VKIVKIMWVPVLLALLYSGWTIWERSRPIQGPQPAVAARDPYGTELKIMGFYAENAVLAPGEKTLLCYGVVHATTVAIEPPVGDVWPSLSRCLEIAPAKTTRYTLTAGDGRKSISSVFEVAVK